MMLAKQIIFILISLVITNEVCFGQETNTILENRTFKVKIKELNPSGIIDKMKDEIVFKNMTISSKFSDGNLFEKSLYWVNIEDKSNTIISFTAEGISNNNDIIRWVGIIKGNKIEGNATWLYKGMEVKTSYTFKGKLK
jgi:hypothetical protein